MYTQQMTYYTFVIYLFIEEIYNINQSAEAVCDNYIHSMIHEPVKKILSPIIWSNLK